MTTHYSIIMSEVQILDKRAHDAEETVKILRDRLEERNDEIAELKSVIDARKKDIVEMFKHLNELGATIAIRDQEIEELTQRSQNQVEIDQLKITIQDRDVGVARLDEKNVDLAQELANAKLKIDDLNATIEYRNEEIAKMIDRLNERAAIISNLSDALDHSNKREAAARKRVDELLAQIDKDEKILLMNSRLI